MACAYNKKLFVFIYVLCVTRQHCSFPAQDLFLITASCPQVTNVSLLQQDFGFSGTSPDSDLGTPPTQARAPVSVVPVCELMH
jgi:hypothetical protein